MPPGTLLPVAEACDALEGADPGAAGTGAVPRHPVLGAARPATWAMERRWILYWRVSARIQ